MKNKKTRSLATKSLAKPDGGAPYEGHAQYEGIRYLIGIDEVGRGPLAGPVTVCACAIRIAGTLDKKSKSLVKEMSGRHVKRLTDSKGLTEKDREAWNDIIRARALSHADIFFKIKNASARQIDAKGIAVCIKGLLRDCLHDLEKTHGINPSECLVMLDGGLKAPSEFVFQETHIKGDMLFPVISFASILAKVHRDAYMKRIAGTHAAYGFERHKGYGTVAHRQAILRHGLSDMHRRSFCRSLHAIDNWCM